MPTNATSGWITVINSSGTATSSSPFAVYVENPACAETNLDAALAGNFSKLLFTGDGIINITTTKMISSDIILDANGHNVTISGGDAMRVLTVNSGVHLTLLNLNIANGMHATEGGAIYNNGGVITAVDCAFTNNAVGGAASGGSSFGGAIYNNNGSLLLTNCTFANNRATGGGGSMGAYSAGTGGMGGDGYGGAILNSGGNIIIANCTFQANLAIGGNGGVGGHGYDGYTYWVSGPFGSGHTVTVPGGPGGQGGGGGNGFGGSLHNSSGGTVTMINVTMSSGAANGGSGGIPGTPGAYGTGDYGAGSPGYNSYGGNIAVTSGSVTPKNTIFAYGHGSPGYNCYGTVIDGGNNICSDSTGGFSPSGSLNNIDPLLATELAANGGPTMTIALLSQSPAINAGDEAAAPTADQRCFPRVGPSDVGAYEYQTPASVISYAWLQSHGFTTDGSAEHADADCDGMNNWQEWIAGTNPTNAASCLKLLSPANTGSGLSVRWQSVSGKKYLLERSTSLGAGSHFSTIESNIFGQPGTTIYLDTSAVGSGPFFYRVGVQQ